MRTTSVADAANGATSGNEAMLRACGSIAVSFLVSTSATGSSVSVIVNRGGQTLGSGTPCTRHIYFLAFNVDKGKVVPILPS